MEKFTSLINSLTNKQRSAVTSSERFLQILAGPGSGKTLVLISRISYILLKHNIFPKDIVVVTFTNKAAKEIKDRINVTIGTDIATRLVSGTFHSFARQYLVKYGYLIGLGIFGIIDRSDSILIIKKYLKEKHVIDLHILVNNITIRLSPSSIMNIISSLKSKSISTNDYSDMEKSLISPGFLYHQEILNIYCYYQEYLLKNKLLDFDDLLLYCLHLFKENSKCFENIKHVFVDEYQDTNLVQYNLIKCLISKGSCLTIVGDPDQSIYSFRSADITNFQRMKHDFPDSTVIFLEDNFRSSGAILNTALKLIEQDTNRPAKVLYSNLKTGFTPILNVLKDHIEEAHWIAKEIKKYVNGTYGFLTYKDFSILVRSSVLIQSIENSFQKFGINYRMIGACKFYDRQEVKDIIAYLRLICFNDELALSRIINVPKRGIGKNTWNLILEKSKLAKKSVLALLEEISQGKCNIRKDKKIENSVSTFIDILNKIRNYIKNQINIHISDIIIYICDLISYKQYLLKEFPDDFNERWSNVLQFINNSDTINSDTNDVYSYFEEIDHTYKGPLIKFLNNIMLFSDTTENENISIPKVTISTIHAAKGLEWPIVFLPGLYNGSVPHSRAEDISEERRLLYVAITRAQAMLYLSYPLKNNFQENLKLSSFLEKISTVVLFEKYSPKLNITFIKTISELLKRPEPTFYFLKSNFDNDISIDNAFCNFYQEKINEEKNIRTEMTSSEQYNNEINSMIEITSKHCGFINAKKILYNNLNNSNQTDLFKQTYNFKKDKVVEFKHICKNNVKDPKSLIESQSKCIDESAYIQELNVQENACNNSNIFSEAQTTLCQTQSRKLPQTSKQEIVPVKRLGIRRRMPKRTMFYGNKQTKF
ncbi:hypothetical protein PMAC_002495 [Pneumocystis sp. 'macacae']|nr:hypothetical protein PMAC_002495 [Pneumocystis sp. 'macacae']